MTSSRVPTGALLLIVPVIAALAIVATAVFASDSDDGSTARRANEVVIEDFAFTPDPLQVKAGTTVRVQNLDDAAHTLTADDGSFDTGDLPGGATKTVVLETPGRYGYFCAIHDYMTGVINVGD